MNWIFNPIMFKIGPITAHWYGFMYALSFITGYLFLQYSYAGKKLNLTEKQKDKLALYTIIGVLLGGRIGYIIFYNLIYYIQNPIKILSVWEGGMSFHGGVIGVTIMLLIFSKQNKIKLLKISDFITNIVPLGVMFVRIGNFINAELYGKIAKTFCINFPTDPTHCRYPSQLLQASLEGLTLFIILYFINKKTKTTGLTSATFLILYAIFRIIAEFFREPDPQLGYLLGIITQGQLLSVIMIIAGITLLIKIKKNAK